MNESGVVATSHELEIKAGTETSNTVPSAFALDDLEAESSPEQPRKTYREQLADLDLSAPGNPHLKETLLKRLDDWEDGVGPEQLSTIASYMHMSKPEVEELLQKRIAELMQRSHFFNAIRPHVFIHDVLGGDKRYKSAIELHMPGTRFHYTFRNAIERQRFGFPDYDTPEGESAKSSRPTYGYFSLNHNGILNGTGKHPPANDVVQYGSVTVKVKRGVAMKRATFSLQDSYSSRSTPVSPIALPHFSALFYFWEDDKQLVVDRIRRFLRRPLDNEAFRVIRSMYTEVQYHGGLTVEDIESVHLSTGNGLNQEEIDRVTAAVAAYNQETGGNILVVLY